MLVIFSIVAILSNAGSIEAAEEEEKRHLQDDDSIDGDLADYLASYVEYADTEEVLGKFPEWIWKNESVAQGLRNGWDNETCDKFLK